MAVLFDTERLYQEPPALGTTSAALFPQTSLNAWPADRGPGHTGVFVRPLAGVRVDYFIAAWLRSSKIGGGNGHAEGRGALERSAR